VAVPLAVGLWTLRLGFDPRGMWATQVPSGGWLVGIAPNDIPLPLYAVAIARDGVVEKERKPEWRKQVDTAYTRP